MANNNDNNNKNYDKNVEKHNHKNTNSPYTVEQIAHMGGEAPHSCRGLGCLEENGKSAKQVLEQRYKHEAENNNENENNENKNNK